MKKILLIMLISCQAIAAHSETLINGTIYNLDNYVQDICIELSISDSIVIHIARISKDYSIPACMCKTGANRYTIYISYASSYNKILEMIAHELVHVKQDVLGKFDATKGTLSIMLNGELKYRNDISRAIEKEAWVIGAAIYKKYKAKYACY